MHCIQYIATKADSVQEAFDEVKGYLEINMGEDGYSNWNDWFVTGGGRWSTSEDPKNNQSFELLTWLSYHSSKLLLILCVLNQLGEGICWMV